MFREENKNNGRSVQCNFQGKNLKIGHKQDNVDDFIRGKFTTSERRIQLNNCVRQSGEELSAKKGTKI